MLNLIIPKIWIRPIHEEQILLVIHHELPPTNSLINPFIDFIWPAACPQ